MVELPFLVLEICVQIQARTNITSNSNQLDRFYYTNNTSLQASVCDPAFGGSLVGGDK